MDQLLLHGYCWGTSFWYGLRGLCRVYDPLMVIGCLSTPRKREQQKAFDADDGLTGFRPPAQANLQANDLEIYNVRTDGWGLIALGLTLLTLSRAYQRNGIRKPYVRGLVWTTVFHHITTAFGAYQHYKVDSHYTAAMWIGVWVNVFLTVVGTVTALGVGSEELEGVKRA